MGYRDDIDGLRAIAVASALLFHLGVSWAPGGFAGVDIFFVISGFLVTGILLRDIEAGQFSLVHFYRKRALRILPALFVVMAATVGIGSWVLLPSEFEELGKTIIATLLFASNVYFWVTLDYFKPDAHENPLLHTRSLGIEAQSYLLIPVLLWLLWRYARRWMLPVFTASVLISLALFVGVVGGWAAVSTPAALRSYAAHVVSLGAYDISVQDEAFRADWRYDQYHLDPRSGGIGAYDKETHLASDDRREVLLFGDSHAAHVWQALSRARPDLNVLQASSTNYRPLPDNAEAGFCGQLTHSIHSDWIPQRRPETVVLSGVFRPEEYKPVAQCVARMHAAGVSRVLVLGKTESYRATRPKILARAALTGSDANMRQAAHLRADLWQADAALRHAVEDAAGEYISLLDITCPLSDCYDRADGVPLLFGTNHYTREGAAFVAERIARHF